MSIRLTLTACLLTVLVINDAHAQQPDPNWPQWLKDAMAEESKPRKGKTIEVPGGTISTHIVGQPAEVQEIDGGWYFASDIEAKSPLECYVFTSAMDLARLADILAESNINAVAEKHGTVANRGIYHTDAGAIGEMPYLALEWIYTAGEAEQIVVGLTKVRVAARGDIALACTHAMVGYRETFEKAFVNFVESTSYTTTTPQPYYEEIALISLGDNPRGVVSVSYTLDDDGDTRIEINEASLTPVDGSTLAVSDSTSTSYSTPDGAMISAHEVSVENGEVALELSLQRTDDDDWFASGEMQQKPVEFTISGDLTPITELGQMAAARALFANEDPDAQAEMDIWVASIDPSQFITARMIRDDVEVPGQATLELGPIAYSGRFDEYGNVKDAVIAMGPLTMLIERIWSRGELPK